MSVNSFFKAFVSFRFSIVLGLAMGLWLYMTQSESQPLSSFLTSKQIYLIALLIVLSFRLIIWVVIEKASFYSVTSTMRNTVIDYITCIISMLSIIGCLFLLQTFIL